MSVLVGCGNLCSNVERRRLAIYTLLLEYFHRLLLRGSVHRSRTRLSTAYLLGSSSVGHLVALGELTVARECLVSTVSGLMCAVASGSEGGCLLVAHHACQLVVVRDCHGFRAVHGDNDGILSVAL